MAHDERDDRWEANTVFVHRYADPKVLEAILIEEMHFKPKDIYLRVRLEIGVHLLRLRS
jgi:hypothetical protein